MEFNVVIHTYIYIYPSYLMNRVSESIPMPYVHHPCQATLGVQAMDTFRHKKALWGQMQMNAIKCHLAISGGLVTFFGYCHHSIKKHC